MERTFVDDARVQLDCDGRVEDFGEEARGVFALSLCDAGVVVCHLCSLSASLCLSVYDFSLLLLSS